IARARVSPSYWAWMIDSTCGVISAAVAPWQARATISAAGVGASPPASEDSVKPARPSTNARRRPRTSPSRAPVTTNVANAIVYIASVSCSWPSDASRSARRLGGARVRIDASIDAIAWPASRMTSARIRRGSRRPRAPSWTFVPVCDHRAVVIARNVFRRDGVRLDDVACRHGRGRGRLEATRDTYGIVFVRRGCFVRSADGTESVVDPTVAYCINAGVEERFDHPHDDGDDCTAMLLDHDVAASLWGGEHGLPSGPVRTAPEVDLEHRLLLAAARRGTDPDELFERAAVLAARTL